MSSMATGGDPGSIKGVKKEKPTSAGTQDDPVTKVKKEKQIDNEQSEPESMSARLDDFMSDVISKIDNLEKKQMRLVKELKKVKDELQEERDSLIKEMKKSEDDQKEDMASLEEEVRSLQKSKADSKKSGVNVLFSARGVNSKAKPNKSIVFKEKLTDNQGYDDTTGMFTADKAGTYNITATVGGSSSTSNAIAYLCVDDQSPHQLRGSSTFSQTVEDQLQLEKGNTVYLKATSEIGNFSNITSFTVAFLPPNN